MADKDIDKDPTFEYNATTDKFTCKVCGKTFDYGSARAHPKRERCLNTASNQCFDKMEEAKIAQEKWIQILEESRTTTPSFGQELQIDFGNTELWKSDILIAFGHSWQFSAERVHNQTFLYLSYIPSKDLEYEIDVKLNIKINGNLHEFTNLKFDTSHSEEDDIFIKIPQLFDSFEFELIKLSIRQIKREEEQATETQHSYKSKRIERLRSKYYNKHTRLLDQWLCRYPISRQALLELLQVLHTPGFDPLMTPPSPYIIEQIRPHFSDTFDVKSLTYQVEGQNVKLPYYTMDSILDHVLKTPRYMDGWHKRSQSEDVNHPSSRVAFKIYEDAHRERLKAGYQLILPFVWIDHFVGQESRNNSFGSVMVSFVNFSTKVLLTQESRFLVTTIPPSLKQFQDDILDKIIVDFCVQLEEGSLTPRKFPFTKDPVNICGGLYCIKADHVEKVGIAGVVGASAGHVPSVYTKTPREEITNVDFKRQLRDPLESKTIIDGLGKLTNNTKRQSATYATGLTGKKSPFWRLKIFSQDFYKRLAICSLHLLHLGITKKYTQEISYLAPKKKKKKNKKKKAKYQEKINERVRELPSAHHMTKITMPIYNKEDNTAGLTGRMWSTWTRVATGLNAGLLNNEQLQRLNVVMEGIRTIEEAIWTDELLDAGVLDDLVKEIVSAIVETSEEVPEAKKTDWNIPNIETLFALTDSIKFLGQLWFQSTDLDEGTNKFHRKCIKVTNHKKVAAHLLKQIAAKRSIDNQRFDTIKDKEDFEEFKNANRKEKKTRKFLEGLHPEAKEMTDEEFGEIQEALDEMSSDDTRFQLKSRDYTSYESVFIKERKLVLSTKPTIIYRTFDKKEHHGELHLVFSADVCITKQNGNASVRPMKFFFIRPIKCIEESPLKQKPYAYDEEEDEERTITTTWRWLPIYSQNAFVCLTAKIKDYSNNDQFFLV